MRAASSPFAMWTTAARRAQGRYPLNPNGSAGDIAGICNDAGNVLGLMPHPEDHVVPIQNPLRRGDRLGLPLFRAFVAQVREGVSTPKLQGYSRQHHFFCCSVTASSSSACSAAPQGMEICCAAGRLACCCQ